MKKTRRRKKLKRPVRYDEKGRPEFIFFSHFSFSFLSLGFCMIHWITTHDAKYHEASLLCSIILVFVGAYENFQQSWMFLFVSRACSVLRYSLATGTVQETWFYALYIQPDQNKVSFCLLRPVCTRRINIKSARNVSQQRGFVC